MVMKSYGRVLLAVLVAATLLLAGCSKATETETPQKSPDTTVNTAPSTTQAISTPAENPPTPAPTPAPAPAPAKKGQAKAKPAPKPAPAPEQAAAPKEAPQTEPQAKAPAVAQTAPAAPVMPVPKVQRVTLPSGTLIPIRMIDSVDSKTDKAGQTYRASIDSDITIEDQIVVPKGADARLTLTLVSSAGEFRGKSELQLELDRIVIGKTGYTVKSDVVEREAKAEGAKTAKEIGIGAAVGAAIGAITGGGKGAAIGAGVGAGGGAAVAAITKGEQVVVPSETRLEFRLQQPVTIAVTVRGPTD
jgi:hypothetical protein